jgi:hypothetical protein
MNILKFEERFHMKNPASSFSKPKENTKVWFAKSARITIGCTIKICSSAKHVNSEPA